MLHVLAVATDDPIGRPDFGWVFQFGGGLAFLLIGAYHVRRSVRDRTLSIGALVFIAALSMSWQEFYGDWGAYLLYNGHFALLPWDSSQWTAPNKPIAVVLAYGWFYSGLFPLMLGALERLRRRFPAWPRWLLATVVGAPVLYAWNFVTADGVATKLGWWTYVDTFGPTLHQAGGNFPLLYPLVLFCFFAVVALWLVDDRDDQGRPRFERLTRANDGAVGWARESARRAGAWVVTLNVCYAVTLMAPLVIVRELWGDPSALVP